MDIPTRKYFDNEYVKKAMRKFTGFEFLDIEGLDPDKMCMTLVDEMPENIKAFDPEMLVKIPARYAFICRLRDLTGMELRDVQRKRKNERMRLTNMALNCDPDRPPAGLKKFTEKSVEAWVETHEDVMKLCTAYDNAETTYTAMCSAVEAMRMYFDAVREALRIGAFEEKYSDLSPGGQPGGGQRPVTQSQGASKVKQGFRDYANQK